MATENTMPLIAAERVGVLFELFVLNCDYWPERRMLEKVAIDFWFKHKRGCVTFGRN